MRAATRTAFHDVRTPQVKETKTKASGSAILGAAAGATVGVGLLLGTSFWAAGLLAVHHDLISRSLPWVSWVAFAGLFHVARAVVFAKQR